MTCHKCEHPIDVTNYVENCDEPISDGAITYTVTDTGERRYHLGSNAYANTISHCPYCGGSLSMNDAKKSNMNNPDLSKYSVYLVIGSKQTWKDMFFKIKLKDMYEYQNFLEIANDSMALSTAAAVEGITHTIKIAIVSQEHKSKYRAKKLKREATADVLASTLKNLGFQVDDIKQIAALIISASVKLNDEELALVNGKRE